MQIIHNLSNRIIYPLLIRSISTNLNKPWRTAYGGKYRITLIHGDGIGPELMQHVKAVIRCIRAPIDFEEIYLTSQNATDQSLEDTVNAVKRNGIAIKGNIASHSTSHSFNVLLRTRLDLFANVIRCKSNPSVLTRHSNVDILVIRENTEGEYSCLEHQSVPGVVESLKIITRNKSLKIAQFAFELAKNNGRKKITVVHKANIMKLSDGLFVECCQQISKDYPQIEFNSMIIDNTCMQLVHNPNQFDVMLMPNLYGNIISHVCAGLIGGAGFVAGANYGDHYAIFEQGTRTTGLAIAGKDLVNPCGILFATANMFKYFGFNQYSIVIKNALLNTIENYQIKTKDLGGKATTTQFIDKVLQEIDQLIPTIGFNYEIDSNNCQLRIENIA